MITELYAGTATIGVTEYSLPNNAIYSSAAAITTDGVYQIFIELATLTASEVYDIKIYEKVRSTGTQRFIYEARVDGAQVQPWVSPSLILMNGWDVTMYKVAGTDRAIEWSIRQVA